MLRLSLGLLLCIMAGSVNDASPLYMILVLGIPGMALMAWPVLDGTVAE
jgi:hypothetical protein